MRPTNPIRSQLHSAPKKRMQSIQLFAFRTGDTMSIRLSDDKTKTSLESIKRYFRERLDQDIGDLKARLMLEFFLEEIGPSVYNDAISDAQAYLRDRVADLEGACFAAEFSYWPRAAVRRSPQ
jgi:uncharacterized protein (DUF2164 family)